MRNGACAARRLCAIGIAADRWSYLVFEFASSSFLAGRHGHMGYELFFKPQADHRYEIEVTYHDAIYDVVLRERQPHGMLREMPDLDVEPCHLSFAAHDEAAVVVV